MMVLLVPDVEAEFKPKDHFNQFQRSTSKMRSEQFRFGIVDKLNLHFLRISVKKWSCPETR